MIVFIGDEPSKRTDPNQAFKGAGCEKRLMTWIEYLLPSGELYELYNRVSPYAATWTLCHVDRENPIIALGKNASDWLGPVPHFKLPHPSGRNRQLNDKEFVKARLEACKEYILLNRGSHEQRSHQSSSQVR